MKNFHPSHWLWLLALAISVPHVALAATAPKSVACGKNFNCLIKKAAACQPATGTVVFSGRHPLFSAFFGPEFRAKIVTQYTIKGRQGAKCLFNFKNTETVGSYTKTGRAQLLATGNTDQEIDAELTSFNNSYVEGNANTPGGSECIARVKSNLVKFLRLAKTGRGELQSDCKGDDLFGVTKCDYKNGITCEQKNNPKPSVINEDGTKTRLQENPDGSFSDPNSGITVSPLPPTDPLKEEGERDAMVASLKRVADIRAACLTMSDNNYCVAHGSSACDAGRAAAEQAALDRNKDTCNAAYGLRSDSLGEYIERLARDAISNHYDRGQITETSLKDVDLEVRSKQSYIEYLESKI